VHAPVSSQTEVEANEQEVPRCTPSTPR
jgi:hypothetical protein